VMADNCWHGILPTPTVEIAAECRDPSA